MLYDHCDVKNLFAPLVSLVLALLIGASVRADDHSGLREALDRNEIVSFKSLLDWIERRYVGKVVEVELEDDEGRLIYEIDRSARRATCSNSCSTPAAATCCCSRAVTWTPRFANEGAAGRG